jgi:carbamoyltransferase
VRGEPIVCTPDDAFKCFMGTELDVLAVGNYLLLKEEQDQSLKENYEESYELD